MRPSAMFAGIVSAVALATATMVAAPAAAEPTTSSSASPAGSAGSAAAPAAAAAVPGTVTLQLIDAATGSVARTWTGSPEQIEAVRAGLVPPSDRAAGDGAAGDGAARAGATGGVQTLIHRVTCSDPNSYWVVRNYPPLVCFADAGDINVAIYSVYEVDSGNNIGYFNYCYNNRCYKQSMGRWNYAVFSNRVFVNHIHIN